MSFFGLAFGQNADIDIILDNQDERKMAEIRDENGRKERHYLFFDGESVTGKVNVTLHRKTNRLEHQGIKIQFIGQIELYYDRGNHHEFLSLVKELARPGDILQNTSFDFEFNQVEKPFECYTGANVRLRYFLRVTCARRITDMTKEMDILVHTMSAFPEMNNPIKMEVGIEECLHIEFEYNKSKYHLKDVIVGKIYFLLVRIKIKHMEVAIIKRETTGTGPNILVDSETIAKYEIMDGAPVKGESIPIRVFLAGYDLTPTMRDINKKFSVKYYLNLVLVDEEERRYFKQQEITLWRKSDRPRKMVMGYGPHGGQMVGGGPGGQNVAPGGPYAGGYVHQVPHAMARHNPGDYPSQNVRTAPTPSGPDDLLSPHGGGGVGFVSGMPGPSTARLPTASGVQQDGSREEPIQEEDEYAASEGSAAPAAPNGHHNPPHQEPQLPSEDPQLSPRQISEELSPQKTSPSPSATQVTADNFLEESVAPVQEANAASKEKVSGAASPGFEDSSEAPKDSTLVAKESVGAPAPGPAKTPEAADEEILVAATKELSVTPQTRIVSTGVDDDDDDDRPQPPDDDSVPDMEEDSVVHVSNKSGDESSEDDQDLFSASKPDPGELGAAGGDSANDGL